MLPPSTKQVRSRPQVFIKITRDIKIKSQIFNRNIGVCIARRVRGRKVLFGFANRVIALIDMRNSGTAVFQHGLHIQETVQSFAHLIAKMAALELTLVMKTNFDYERKISCLIDFIA